MNQHLVNYGRGVRRLTLTQPPHFRTGTTQSIADRTPSRIERDVIAAINNANVERTRRTMHLGLRATVPTPKPQKQQAKKIRQVLEHQAGNV